MYTIWFPGTEPDSQTTDEERNHGDSNKEHSQIDNGQ